MFILPIAVLGIKELRLLAPINVLVQPISNAGTKKSGKIKASSCNVKRKLIQPPGGTGRGKKPPPTGLVRAKQPGPVRLGFIPEEWFRFLYSKTGVSGPYILMLGLANYAASKEILVMEHEYYSGLSVALVVILITKNFGRQIGAILDRGVRDVSEQLQKSRDEEIAQHVAVLEEGKLAKTRAQAQEILMAVKKENITFQLEAAYRERLMIVYRTVRNRLQYHYKKSRAISHIQQKWMIQWILENVHKSITPEFQKQALSSAIRDLAAVASQVKK
ncbi:unnamed protein product [Arctia plantaginis]|uniref:ATP synthase subunit b n=1 Tax=Arctia plantaginis TaxID=874455 RepID=A0A8S0Z1D0_ARCPL|nr:unnamed protein product [Arctia plantaginis]